jgi:hypothetical protein
MNESRYLATLIKKLHLMFPGCLVIKNDPRSIQGVPDILILYRNMWAMLEVKASPTANLRPNQEHYIGILNEMSFASFINPENEEGVLNDLQYSFGLERETRLSKSK